MPPKETASAILPGDSPILSNSIHDCDDESRVTDNSILDSDTTFANDDPDGHFYITSSIETQHDIINTNNKKSQNQSSGSIMPSFRHTTQASYDRLVLPSIRLIDANNLVPKGPSSPRTISNIIQLQNNLYHLVTTMCRDKHLTLSTLDSDEVYKLLYDWSYENYKAPYTEEEVTSAVRSKYPLTLGHQARLAEAIVNGYIARLSSATRRPTDS